MPLLKSPVLLVVATQALFTAGDLLARSQMKKGGFTLPNFLSVWFVAYFALRTVAMFGQLCVFAAVPVGKSMALFGATSITLVNVLGVLLLGEVLSPTGYVGVALAVTAFLVMSVG